MSLDVWCGHCNGKVTLRDGGLGATVHCPLCGGTFVAEEVPTVAPRPDAGPAAVSARPLPRPALPPPLSQAAVPPPLPRPTRRREPTYSLGVNVGIIAAVAGAVLGLIVLGVVTVLLLDDRSRDPGPVAKVPGIAVLPQMREEVRLQEIEREARQAAEDAMREVRKGLEVPPDVKIGEPVPELRDEINRLPPDVRKALEELPPEFQKALKLAPLMPKDGGNVIPPRFGARNDPKTGASFRTIEIAGKPNLTVRFSSDGKRLVTGGDDGMVRLWDFASGKETESFVGEGPAEFGRDGNQVFYRHDNAIRVRDLVRARNLPERFEGTTFRLSGDRARLLTFDHKEKLARNYDARTGQMAASWKVEHDTMAGPALSPDGTGVAFGHFIEPCEVRDANTGAVRHRLRDAAGTCLPCWSPDGKTLAVPAHGGSTITLYDAATGKTLRSFDEPTRRPPWMLAFSPDGKKLASGALNGVVRLWDAETGKSLGRLSGGDVPEFADGVERMITDLTFSPDGRYLAASSRGRVEIWEIGPQAEKK